MTSSRWTPFAGIAFVVLYIAGWIISRSPDSSDPVEKIGAYYADKDHRVMMIVAAYILLAAGLAFLWFLGGLRSRLAAVEGGSFPLTTVAFAAGVVFVALLIGGVFALGAVPGNISFGKAKGTPSGDVVNTVQSLGYGMILIGGMISAGVTIALTSFLTLRTRVFPSWTAWLGFLAAVALLFAVVFLPQIALLIWVLAISGVMLARPAVAAPATMP